MQQLSIYDLDKTITRAATFIPFMAYAVPRNALWRVIFLPLVFVAALGFGLKLVKRGQLKEFNVNLLLGRRIGKSALEDLAKGFARKTVTENVLQPALQQIERERAEGRMIMLASASYAIYVAEIGALLGITEIVGTRMVQHGDMLSPMIDGENCYGPAKLEMVQAHLAQRQIVRADCHIRFYSDHVSDTPCLEWADEGYATSPHMPLRRRAEQRGWPILDWAKA